MGVGLLALQVLFQVKDTDDAPSHFIVSGTWKKASFSRSHIGDKHSCNNKLVELKVGVHCDKCLKAIKKAIKKIEDIETYKVDAELSKVTVTGNVTTEEVVRVLQKIGKTATPWEEN